MTGIVSGTVLRIVLGIASGRAARAHARRASAQTGDDLRHKRRQEALQKKRPKRPQHQQKAQGIGKKAGDEQHQTAAQDEQAVRGGANRRLAGRLGGLRFGQNGKALAAHRPQPPKGCQKNKNYRPAGTKGPAKRDEQINFDGR